MVHDHPRTEGTTMARAYVTAVLMILAMFGGILAADALNGAPVRADGPALSRVDYAPDGLPGTYVAAEQAAPVRVWEDGSWRDTRTGETGCYVWGDCQD